MSPQPRLHECVRAFESQFDHVHRVLRRQGVPAADVDDMAQEVFIVMWRRWPEFDRTRDLRPWLDGIAFNVVGNHRRRAGREIPLPDLDVMDPTPQGEDRLAAARAKRVVLRALERLPESSRTVLALHDVDGVPMRRIAELQKVPLFTAYTRLRKARRDFAAAVKAELDRPRRALIPSLGLKIALPVASLAAAAIWLVPPRPHLPGAADLGSGLQAYWRFDERAGIIAHDHSSRGRDCVLRGLEPAAVWRQGRMGGSAELDGRSFLDCPQPALAEAGPRALTVALWARVRSIPSVGNRALVSRQLGSGALDHFFLGFVKGRLLANSDSWDAVVSARAPADGRWHHLAFTASAAGVALYVDGQSVATGTPKQPRLDRIDAPILIGGGSNVPGVVHERLEGGIDEALIYDRALGAGEIAALATGNRP